MKEEKIIFIDEQGMIHLLVTTNDKTLTFKSVYKKVKIPDTGGNWEKIEKQEKWKCILDEKGKFHHFESSDKEALIQEKSIN